MAGSGRVAPLRLLSEGGFRVVMWQYSFLMIIIAAKVFAALAAFQIPLCNDEVDVDIAQ